jgi:hypothetical protein
MDIFNGIDTASGSTPYESCYLDVLNEGKFLIISIYYAHFLYNLQSENEHDKKANLLNLSPL